MIYLKSFSESAELISYREISNNEYASFVHKYMIQSNNPLAEQSVTEPFSGQESNFIINYVSLNFKSIKFKHYESEYNQLVLMVFITDKIYYYIQMTKFPDEWFIAYYNKYDKDTPYVSLDSSPFYMCDQITGLIECLEFFKNRMIK